MQPSSRCVLRPLVSLAILLFAALAGPTRADLLYQNTTTGDVVEWVMNRTAHVSTLTLASQVSTALQIVGTPNLTGATSPGILWQNKTTGDVLYWVMNKTSHVSTLTIASGVPTVWRIVGTP